MKDNKKVIPLTIKTDKFSLESLEYHLEGNLKGYAYGDIEFSNGKKHELHYRFYDPCNGDSNTIVSIDYGFENPMVNAFWHDIETEIKKAINGVIQASLKEPKVPITAEQALTCLRVSPDEQVHSFTIAVCLSGADLDFNRVTDIIKGASEVDLLFFTEELGKRLYHNIAAWDHLYNEWVYNVSLK